MFIIPSKNKRKDFFMLIDLHVHSNYSDGSLSPSELIDLAIKKDLSVIALTDHDTLAGIDEAQRAVNSKKEKGFNITLVPGVEISIFYKGHDIHILGLLIDNSNTSLNKALEEANNKRNIRNEKIADKFRNDGIPITIEKLQEKAEDSVITRAHFAMYLVEHGYAKSTNDAFNRFLSKDSPYYVARDYLSPEKGIELIHGANGLAFIAHPLLYDFTQSQVIEMIEDFKKMGIDGIEAIYSSNTKEQESFLIDLAKENNLLITGGTDFHGDVKPDLELGKGKGNMKIPYSIYEKMLIKKDS